MKRKTFYIIAAVWFVLVVIVIASSFLPIVDAATQETIKRYMILIVCVGAICMMLIRRMVKDDK